METPSAWDKIYTLIFVSGPMCKINPTRYNTKQGFEVQII